MFCNAMVDNVPSSKVFLYQTTVESVVGIVACVFHWLSNH